ncbi:FtsK/SpoIIIE domain-containing protein [Cellulomonas sp. KH9]|uniref:FtsK/SpoIIIE domain-containing protein n=1 Tax=Cellulomonas sp. KH9 TaxID=1855324 RepID=UPI0008DFF2C7|nr:FtsK/SpoIIIE domain-containing protein [Cellulomonas sp. KH9]SFK55280.1 DNA segregation ATPase FtsK/SpoIIIE, S-DNA-T family [Cellulomonas sp. KH9]
MRFSVPSSVGPDHTLDVDVEPGVTAGEVRRRLTLLTGDVRWAAPGTRLGVAGAVVDDHHPAGARPLLPGSHLTGGPGVPDDAAAAVLAGAHVAVLDGPEAGRVVPLPDGARVVVALTAASPGAAPGGRADRPAALLEVRRRGVAVQVRAPAGRGAVTTAPGRAAHRGWVRRAPGRAGARARPVGRRWRPWSPASTLHGRACTLVLRGAAVEGSARRRRLAVTLPAWAWTSVASAGVALALAVALRQPLLLLTAVTGLVGLVGARAGDRRAADAQRPGDGAALPDGRVGTGPGTTTPEGASARATSAAGASGHAPPAPTDVAALRVATAARLADRAGPVAGDPAPWPADRTIALVGARGATTAAARALVLRTLGAGGPARLVLRTGRPAEWGWARWWEPRAELPAPDDHDVLVVLDGDAAAVGGWRATAPAARLLLVLPPGAAVPAWVGTVLHPSGGVVTTGRRRPARTTARPPEAVAPDVADAQARAAAALAWVLGADAAAASRTTPVAASLGCLPGVPAARADHVLTAWHDAADASTLASPLGVGTGGRTVVLDLVRDGPHALVAGTTGAGKSELLTTLVLGLALRHPPHRLAVLLVDFKGGTGLGPLAGLPHVVGHVHDLDVAAARRTLGWLRAELRRRERLLAATGRTDLTDLDPAHRGTPARLLVVVDELRALVDDLPEAAGALARLAAQGRALGMHLVLATQRPAGAVPADLRANVGLRIALRVAGEDDSRDVVGCPDAAHLDPTVPGRALLQVAARPVTVLQVASARRRARGPAVRLAAPPGEGGTVWHATPPRDDDVATWVAACARAARGGRGTGVPWLPPLPDRVPADAVDDPDRGRPGLLVAVADVPDEQRREPVRWRPDHGPLLAVGGPRSGRSTVLLRVGTEGLRAGMHVHAVGLPGRAVDRLRATAAGLVGTAVPVDDVHRTVLLLERLTGAARADAPARLLLVDGLDALLEALGSHARGVGVDLLTGLLRRPPPGVHVAAAGPVVAAVTRLTGAFGLRLVLPVPDATLDALAGVPGPPTGPRTTPGRAVACSADGVRLCQVVLPAGRASGPAPGSRGPAPVRIGLLPLRAPAPAVGGSTGIPLGVGGEGPDPVDVDPARPLVVAGPPGSGRTSTLRTLARGWAAAGRAVVLVGGAEDATAVRPAAGGVVVSGTQAVTELLETAQPCDAPAGGPPAEARTRRTAPATVLLVDDADLLDRTAPRLVDLLERVQQDPRHPVRVVALTTTTDHAATAFRGPVATALRGRQVLVLDAQGPAALDLLGPGAAVQTDPWRRPPGRGVLRLDRTVLRVQVHEPPAQEPPVPAAP